MLRGVPQGEIEVVFGGRGSYIEGRKLITVAGQEEVSSFDFNLETGASISGQVTDVDTGFPVNITIALRNVLADGPNVHVKTHVEGRYALTGVAPGTYRIQLCCEGQHYILEYYDDRLIKNEADLITFTGSEDLEGFDIEARRGATVSGRIRDAGTGLPIPGVRVRAGLAAWPYLRFAYTDSEGQYILRGVPDGDIAVLVDGQGYVEQRKNVEVINGRNLTGVDF